MKKIIAMSMSLILMAGVITGCSGEPGKKETLELLDRIYGGERFELDGNLVRSRDRDIEFYYWYDYEGTPIWPDIDIELGGKYILKSTYFDSVHQYWNDEYRAAIEKYDFRFVDYGEDGDDEERCCPDYVYIIIEDGASPEELAKVESLLSDLREICRDEEEFHDSDYSEEYGYFGFIWYVNGDTGEYQKTFAFRIEADTRDERLKLENISINDMDKSDPHDMLHNNGIAMIYVN